MSTIILSMNPHHTPTTPSINHQDINPPHSTAGSKTVPPVTQRRLSNLPLPSIPSNYSSSTTFPNRLNNITATINKPTLPIVLIQNFNLTRRLDLPKEIRNEEIEAALRVASCGDSKEYQDWVDRSRQNHKYTDLESTIGTGRRNRTDKMVLEGIRSLDPVFIPKEEKIRWNPKRDTFPYGRMDWRGAFRIDEQRSMANMLHRQQRVRDRNVVQRPRGGYEDFIDVNGSEWMAYLSDDGLESIGITDDELQHIQTDNHTFPKKLKYGRNSEDTRGVDTPLEYTTTDDITFIPNQQFSMPPPSIDPSKLFVQPPRLQSNLYPQPKTGINTSLIKLREKHSTQDNDWLLRRLGKLQGRSEDYTF